MGSERFYLRVRLNCFILCGLALLCWKLRRAMNECEWLVPWSSHLQHRENQPLQFSCVLDLSMLLFADVLALCFISYFPQQLASYSSYCPVDWVASWISSHEISLVFLKSPFPRPGPLLIVLLASEPSLLAGISRVCLQCSRANQMSSRALYWSSCAITAGGSLTETVIQGCECVCPAWGFLSRDSMLVPVDGDRLAVVALLLHYCYWV